MNGHNYGLCNKCGRNHIHPMMGRHYSSPLKGKHLSESTKKKISESRSGKYFGEDNPNWKGGKMLIDGYYYIYSPNHKNATKTGYVAEHRLVIEKNIGRFLSKEEVIHHIDGNKLNNNIENLSLEESTGKHFIRNHLKKRDAIGRFL